MIDKISQDSVNEILLEEKFEQIEIDPPPTRQTTLLNDRSKRFGDCYFYALFFAPETDR